MPEAYRAVTGPDEDSLEGCLQSPSLDSSLSSASEVSPELTGRTRSTSTHPAVWLSSRGRGNGSYHKMTNERFQAGTTELSPWPSSSSSSSSSERPIAGATDTQSGQQMMSVTCPDIRKRPRINDLQQHASTSRIANEKHPAQTPKPILTPPAKRRCASANAATRARSRFASPDRYVPQRPSVDQGCRPYHTSKSPSSLRGRELYTRQRDHTRNPFRTVSDRSNEVARRRDGHNRYGLRFPHYTPSFVIGDDASPFAVDRTTASQTGRQLSWGGFWTIGGRNAAQLGHLHAVPTGAAGMTASGTNAPMHTPSFLDAPTRDDQVEAHEGRLALAMGIDQATKMLQYTPPSLRTPPTPASKSEGLKWRDNAWTGDRMPQTSDSKVSRTFQAKKSIPTVAFRVLDAPHLKDDYYCSILAYSYTSRTLAVALTNKVYLWTEEYGVRYPPLPRSRASNFVTSLAFSSDEGGNSILAVARHSGNVTLWSLLEAHPRFGAPHPAPASCIAFRPTVAYRQGTNSNSIVLCEDLLVGDETGRIYYYSLEWSSVESGCMSLLIKLDAHSQNICGLAWTPDGESFVSGGNDNVALLFKVDSVLEKPRADNCPKSISEQSLLPSLDSELQVGLASSYPTPPTSPQRPYIAGIHPMVSIFELPQRAASRNGMESPPTSPVFSDQSGREPARGASATRGRTNGRKTFPVLNNDLANPRIVGHINMHAFSFHHSAAVKAIAFAPWQPTLLATGGGSNDRQIHFHHTGSGATLAVINVFAQVTSLIWSTTRREIVATFGYAQPEHDIRIAVFSWPSCECVVSIPWERKLNGEIGRALWAIPYPGGPNDAVPTRTQTNEGFAAWEAVRLREEQRRRAEVPAVADDGSTNQTIPEDRGRSIARTLNPQPTEGSPHRRRQHHPGQSQSRVRSRLRGEGETWASRTEEEGSLIIACCDQTVKFFEVWAGKSKGRGLGLGSKEGVLGGSRVLEGWCEGVDGVEVGREDVIR